MHGLRHKSLSSKQAAPKGGGTQTGCTVDGVGSSRVDTRRTKAQASIGDGEQFRINTRRARAEGGNTQRSSAACGQIARNGEGGKSSNLIRGSAAGGQLACSPDGGNSTRNSAAGVSSKVVGTEGANLETTNLNGVNTQTVGDDSGNSQMVGNSQRSNANGLNSQIVRDVSSNSQRSNANGLNSQLNFDSEGANSQLNIGSNQSSQDPPKRGRAKMCRTKYKIPPRSGRVQLESIGHW